MRWRAMVGLLGAAACSRGEGSASTPAATSSAALVEASEEQASAARTGHKEGKARAAGERLTVPAGTFRAGSVPGDRGREPTMEATELEVTLGEFQIDALAHPNDPARPALTGVSRERAAVLCDEAGGRLCSELEWERACKGPEGQEYAGSAGWDPECAKHPDRCASGFGVLGMGAAMREWTASDVEPLKGYRSNAAAAVRGARAEVADVDHRCAHRAAVDATVEAPDLGFRCCYGSRPTATIPVPPVLAPVQKIEFPSERLESLFASNPKLKALAAGVKFFREESAVAAVTQRGRSCAESAPPTGSETLTTSPLLWNPAPGEEILLVTGQSAQNRSFIVAFHRLSGDRYRVAAAMQMDDEPGPITLVFNSNVRRKLEWAIGWQCPAESGNITYRDDNRVVITQK